MKTFKQHIAEKSLKEDLGSPETIHVGKGLTKDEALSRAKRKATKDWRGVSYNEKAGTVTLT